MCMSILIQEKMREESFAAGLKKKKKKVYFHYLMKEL